MPEPNLPPINLNSVDMDALRDSLPEMPDLTREALNSYNLRQQEIEIMVVSVSIKLRPENETFFLNSLHSLLFVICRNTQTY